MHLISMKNNGNDNFNKCHFKLNQNDIQKLIPNMGYCFATNKITIDGLKVGYMYREIPEDKLDSGWRFFSGTESQIYVDNPNNTQIYDLNTIANYDKAIIPYLNSLFGSEYERIDESDIFQLL